MSIITVKMFTATGGGASHPSVELAVPPDYKILGGGAVVDTGGAGSLLTAAYPKTLNRWFAAAKDHCIASPAAVTAYVLALHDPNDEWDVIIWPGISNAESHPRAFAALPAGYTLTGGGALVQWTGAGNLLTASFPHGAGWEARSKDHTLVDPARITAYAIGMRHRRTGVQPRSKLKQATGPVGAHPAGRVLMDPGWILTGGGVLDDTAGEGNLLTASSPGGNPDQPNLWWGAGKDHMLSSPGAITAFALGIQA